MRKNVIVFILFAVLCCLQAGTINLNAQEGSGIAPGTAIELKQVDAMKAVVVKFDIPMAEIGEAMGQAYGKLYGFLGANGITPAGPPFAVYYSFNPGGNTVFEAGVPVGNAVKGNEEISFREFPAMQVVYTLYEGPYDAMEPTYGEMNKYMAEKGLESDSTAWEIYLSDPTQVTDPKDYQTIIYMPIK